MEFMPKSDLQRDNYQHKAPSTHTQSTKTNRFKYSGKTSPCPVCQRTKDADCRWKDSVVLCHTYVDQNACVRDYIYRGATKCSTWGQYFLEVEPKAKPIRPSGRKEFLYYDADGQLLVKVVRVDSGIGKKTFSQLHWKGSEWVKGLTKEIQIKLHLYRISDPINQNAIASSESILIVEGEGIVDLLLSMKIASTSCIGGAGKWRSYGYPNYLNDLAGAKIVVCPDRDEPGMKHCVDISQDFPEAQWLYAFPDSLIWNRLPKNQGADLADWIADYRLSAEQVLASIGSKREFVEPELHSNQAGKQSNVDRLMAIASKENYFHSPDGVAYADIFVNDHHETVRLHSERFKSWLNHKFYTHYQKTVSSEAFNSCLGVLEGQAKFAAEAQEVYFRISEHQDKVYLDLGTSDWAIVEISSEGWQIVKNCPVKFRRSTSMLPLPVPQRGGNIAELDQVLNCSPSEGV